MNLKDHLASMPMTMRAAFAARCGTTRGHLQNVAHARRDPSPVLCVAIERFTNGVVSRCDLRPDDWREIWPDLEEVEHLRAQVAQLLARLRIYELDAAPALTLQAPAAINSEASA